MATRKKTTTKAQTETKEDQESTENIAVLGTDLNSSKTSLREKLQHKVISINSKVNPFYGVGPIWLTIKDYCAVIPDNLTEVDYQRIDNAIREGKIVLGSKFIPPVDKDDSIFEEVESVIKHKGREDIIKFLRQVLEKKTIKGYTSTEILDKCMEVERQSRNRKDITDLITSTQSMYKGPVSVYDPPDTEKGIKKVTISEGKIIIERNNGSTEIMSPESQAKEEDLPEASKKTLDSLFD